MSCKTISFDSSTQSTGYSIYINGEYKSNGLIDKKKIKDTQDRIHRMIKDIYDVIDSENPDIVIWEVPVMVNANPETQRTLDFICGSILGKCVSNDIFYYSFRPSEWRNVVKDNEKLPRKRDELKLWGKSKVEDLFGLSIDCDDVTDAILIGYAYMKKFSEDKND